MMLIISQRSRRKAAKPPDELLRYLLAANVPNAEQWHLIDMVVLTFAAANGR